MNAVCWVYYRGVWYIRWGCRRFTTEGDEHEYGSRKYVTDDLTINALERQHNERVFTGPKPPMLPGW